MAFAAAFGTAACSSATFARSSIGQRAVMRGMAFASGASESSFEVRTGAVMSWRLPQGPDKSNQRGGKCHADQTRSESRDRNCRLCGAGRVEYLAEETDIQHAGASGPTGHEKMRTKRCRSRHENCAGQQQSAGPVIVEPENKWSPGTPCSDGFANHQRKRQGLQQEHAERQEKCCAQSSWHPEQSEGD